MTPPRLTLRRPHIVYSVAGNPTRTTYPARTKSPTCTPSCTSCAPTHRRQSSTLPAEKRRMPLPATFTPHPAHLSQKPPQAPCSPSCTHSCPQYTTTAHQDISPTLPAAPPASTFSSTTRTPSPSSTYTTTPHPARLHHPLLHTSTTTPPAPPAAPVPPHHLLPIHSPPHPRKPRHGPPAPSCTPRNPQAPHHRRRMLHLLHAATPHARARHAAPACLLRDTHPLLPLHTTSRIHATIPPPCLPPPRHAHAVAACLTHYRCLVSLLSSLHSAAAARGGVGSKGRAHPPLPCPLFDNAFGNAFALFRLFAIRRALVACARDITYRIRIRLLMFSLEEREGARTLNLIFLFSISISYSSLSLSLFNVAFNITLNVAFILFSINSTLILALRMICFYPYEIWHLQLRWYPLLDTE